MRMEVIDNSVDGNFKISHLQNSIYYFLEGVSIIKQDTGYRLIVLRNGRLLDDTVYNTVKGARIGFARRYKEKLWDGEVAPQWSPFYAPGTAAW